MAAGRMNFRSGMFFSSLHVNIPVCFFRLFVRGEPFSAPGYEKTRIMQVDVKTSEAVPTNEFINVSVDGVANVKISSDKSQLETFALPGYRTVPS